MQNPSDRPGGESWQADAVHPVDLDSIRRRGAAESPDRLLAAVLYRLQEEPPARSIFDGVLFALHDLRWWATAACLLLVAGGTTLDALNGRAASPTHAAVSLVLSVPDPDPSVAGADGGSHAASMDALVLRLRGEPSWPAGRNDGLGTREEGHGD
ncbi:MAG: hypothetical protein HKO53_01090 [Gemmatimonadetes bacterium]|nr:hypothetical protein [Gemmatimonadota bacterium]NNM31627.1 hypothetical protein [Gemmatimonadota bacterium]